MIQNFKFYHWKISSMNIVHKVEKLYDQNENKATQDGSTGNISHAPSVEKY
jgi:hypothetical protein